MYTFNTVVESRVEILPGRFAAATVFTLPVPTTARTSLVEDIQITVIAALLSPLAPGVEDKRRVNIVASLLPGDGTGTIRKRIASIVEETVEVHLVEVHLVWGTSVEGSVVVCSWKIDIVLQDS